MASDSKQLLEKRLARILNLSSDDDHDYVTDVLDQLMEMSDDPENITEYLSSFVVDDGGGEDLHQFALDLNKFSSGEKIVTEDDSKKKESFVKKPEPSSTATRILDEGAAQREQIKLREREAREKQREEQERMKKKKEEEEERRRRELAAAKKKQPESAWGKKTETGKGGGGVGSKSKVSVGKNPAAVATKSKSVDNTISGKGGKKPSSGTVAVKKDPPKQINLDRPQKGKAKVVCGCYGNKHPPLTNCLHCGRISCEREGYDYCPFCEYLITGFVSGNNDEKFDSAMAHKERLLEFDRTSASRTHIHDDQEDYFVTSTNMWSNEEEKENALAMEEERQKKLHQREHKLDITF